VGLLQQLLSSHVTRHLLPGHLPRKQPSRTSVSGLPQARVSYGGMCPGRGQMSRTGADRTEPAPHPPCQQTHMAFSLSRPGGVAVPWRTASIGLHSEVIQHSQMLPTRCPQPIVLSHARHLICKCITLTFLNVQIYMYIPCIISINVLFIVLQVTNNCSYRPRI